MNKGIILVLLIALCQTSFVDNRNFTLPTGVFDMQYSPNQKFFYVITQSPNAIYYFNGFTGASIANISYPTQFVPESLTISEDSKYVGVGSNGGGVKVYEQQGTTLVSVKQQNFTSTSKINDLAFSADNSILLVGTFAGQISLWQWQSEDVPSFTSTFGTNLFALVWSRTNTKQFWVGGGLDTTDKLTIYEVLQDNGTITGINQKQNLTQKNSVIADMATGSNEKMNAGSIYRVGSSGEVYVYDSVSLTDSVIDKSTLGALSKISVTDNEELIVISATSLVGTLNRTNGTDYVFESYPSALPTFALSSTGGNLIVAPNAETALVKGECPEGQYFNQATKQCFTCDSDCNICFGAADVCESCANRYYLEGQKCLKCLDGCETCQDGNSCDSCRTQDKFQPDGNLCKCVDGTFDVTDECIDCVKGCRVCDNSATCQTCWSERGFQPSGLVCSCQDRFYDSDNNCLACERGCFTCSDATTCSKCDDENHYVDGDNNTCVCDTVNHFIDEGNLCVCQPGYYEDVGACLKCPMGCTQCSSANNCSACDPDKTIRDNVCKCQIGSYIDANDVCQLCNETLKYCIECDSGDTCEKCVQNENRELVDGQCPCRATYFDSNETCLSCGINGCLKCQNTQNCTSCDAQNNWEVNPTTSLCSCMKKYVQVNNLCESCPLGCNTCDQNKTCSECDSNDHWIDDGLGGCKCESWYYFDNTSSTCAVCMAGCSDCDQSDICNTCDVADHFSKVGNDCVCDSTYYLNSRNCSLCSGAIQRCSTCDNASTCKTCKSPFKLKNSKLCGCDDGKYINSNQCSDCPEECTKCSNAEQCTDCKDGYNIEDGICKSDGLDTLVIVMIVVGVLAVAGAGFAIIKCIKKKRSPLEEEGYETMQNQD